MRSIWDVRREVSKEGIEVFLRIVVPFLEDTHAIIRAHRCIWILRLEFVQCLQTGWRDSNIARLKLVVAPRHVGSWVMLRRLPSPWAAPARWTVRTRSPLPLLELVAGNVYALDAWRDVVDMLPQMCWDMILVAGDHRSSAGFVVMLMVLGVQKAFQLSG